MKNLLVVVSLMVVVFCGFKMVGYVLEQQKPATILSEQRVGNNALITMEFKKEVTVRTFTVGNCKVVSPVQGKAYNKGDYVAVEFNCEDYSKRNYQLGVSMVNGEGYLYY